MLSLIKFPLAASQNSESTGILGLENRKDKERWEGNSLEQTNSLDYPGYWSVPMYFYFLTLPIDPSKIIEDSHRNFWWVQIFTALPSFKLLSTRKNIGQKRFWFIMDFGFTSAVIHEEIKTDWQNPCSLCCTTDDW